MQPGSGAGNGNDVAFTRVSERLCISGPRRTRSCRRSQCLCRREPDRGAEGGRSRLREEHRPQGGLQPRRIERPRPADQGRRAGRRVLLGGQGPDGRPGKGRSRPRAGPRGRPLQRPRRHRARVVHGAALRSRRSAERQASGPGRSAGGSGRGVRPHLARVRGPLEQAQGQGRSDPQRARGIVGRGVGERRCRHRVPHRCGDIEARKGGLRGAEGAGAGHRLSARAHRGFEASRHRGSGARISSPLALGRSMRATASSSSRRSSAC